ncbi:hypothetical protein F3J17_10015 [Burkholderia sp. Ax-1719]|nr:hypothetical protein [Burkholderia sp. Ax-1719]
MRDVAVGARVGGLPCAKMVRADTPVEGQMERIGIAGAFMSGRKSNKRRDGWRPICAIVGLDARFVVDLNKARKLFQRDDKTVAVML